MQPDSALGERGIYTSNSGEFYASLVFRSHMQDPTTPTVDLYVFGDLFGAGTNITILSSVKAAAAGQYVPGQFTPTA